MRVTCADFDAAAEDLALGFTPTRAQERDALIAHAASCPACGALLRELTTVVDAVLEFSPEAEPPVGFEAKAVVAMQVQPASRRSPERWRLVPAVAIAAAALVISGLVMTGDDVPTEVAAVQYRDGRRLGRVELVAAPSPKLIVVLEDDDWPGVWVCELEDDDGTWVEVGRWTAEDATAGAWATAVHRSLLDATRMRITSASGAVIATSDALS